MGTITYDGNNIDSGTSCGWVSVSGSMSSTNLKFGSLANNGGSTATFVPLPGSPAIDGVTFSSPNNAPSNDQRSNNRPQGVRYDIGSYELDSKPPTVLSITRTEANPTSAANVHFIVTFSKAVTGVDVDDFDKTVTGMITFLSVSGVIDGPATYTVTAKIGAGNGTLRLNVPIRATINHMVGKPLASLPYTGGVTYTITKGFAIFLPLILR